MGRIHPDFLFRARSRPPKKTGPTSKGQPPARTRFTNAVRALRNSKFPSWHIIMSRMCWWSRPSGPPTEPAGNERIAWQTSDSSTAICCSGQDAARSFKLLEAFGCFSLRALGDSCEGAAGMSSDSRIRTAARTFPSSNFVGMAWLSVVLEFLWAYVVEFANSLSVRPAAYDEILHLIVDYRPCRIIIIMALILMQIIWPDQV